jgi:hypothetical protein
MENIAPGLDAFTTAFPDHTASKSWNNLGFGTVIE